MKKSYLIAGAGLLAGFGLVSSAAAWKAHRRGAEVNWEDFSGELPFADRSQFMQINGLRIHVQEFGERHAPAILLIHGYGASGYTWAQVVERLADEGFRVIVPDLIGHGFSAKPLDGEYTFGWHAQMLCSLLDRLGVGRAVVVGSSYGGAVAATLAQTYPERVEKLILVGAVSNDNARSLPLARAIRVPLLGELVALMLGDNPYIVRMRMKSSLTDETFHLIDAQRVKTAQKFMRHADVNRAMLSTMRNWNAAHVEREAGSLRLPTLLVWGEGDRLIPLHNGMKLLELIPDSRLIVFRRCGHVPHEEYPSEFCDVVVKFISS